MLPWLKGPAPDARAWWDESEAAAAAMAAIATERLFDILPMVSRFLPVPP